MASYDALSHFTIRAQAASLPFFIVSNVVFIMRSVSRVRYTRQPLGWEDLVLSASWPLNIVRMATFQLALVTTRHVDPADLPGTIPTPAFWAIFTDTWAFLSVTLPKVGVAILLVRVFQPPLWQRKIMLSMAVGLFAYCLAGFGITFAQCRPVAAQWDPFQYPDAACRPRYIMMYYAQPGAGEWSFAIPKPVLS
ncbi:hypothetical protein ANO11243_076290 [Dothideomycetidae sp. 11243]|nr:hypothetical protein ANO11243_076290 [fungal sp. No.11243]